MGGYYSSVKQFISKLWARNACSSNNNSTAAPNTTRQRQSQRQRLHGNDGNNGTFILEIWRGVCAMLDPLSVQALRSTCREFRDAIPMILVYSSNVQSDADSGHGADPRFREPALFSKSPLLPGHKIQNVSFALKFHRNNIHHLVRIQPMKLCQDNARDKAASLKSLQNESIFKLLSEKGLHGERPLASAIEFIGRPNESTRKIQGLISAEKFPVLLSAAGKQSFLAASCTVPVKHCSFAISFEPDSPPKQTERLCSNYNSGGGASSSSLNEMHNTHRHDESVQLPHIEQDRIEPSFTPAPNNLEKRLEPKPGLSAESKYRGKALSKTAAEEAFSMQDILCYVLHFLLPQEIALLRAANSNMFYSRIPPVVYFTTTGIEHRNSTDREQDHFTFPDPFPTMPVNGLFVVENLRDQGWGNDKAQVFLRCGDKRHLLVAHPERGQLLPHTRHWYYRILPGSSIKELHSGPAADAQNIADGSSSKEAVSSSSTQNFRITYIVGGGGGHSISFRSIFGAIAFEPWG